MSAAEIVNKVWNYAHVLRDDGVGYGDYVEQITYLIFLKMADKREKPVSTSEPPLAFHQVFPPLRYGHNHRCRINTPGPS
ncbi:MAG: type I restriction-modification system subunit M N-terminal domain-containing protein [Candidatus Thiodiazotropha sp.]